MLATISSLRVATPRAPAAAPRRALSAPAGPQRVKLSQFDKPIQDIVNYVTDYKVTSDEALNTSRLTSFDAIGCGLFALSYPECTKLLGPIVPGTVVPHGSRVPGTPHVLDPVHAAFNIGCMNRWLDWNDTYLAAEWGHPSDNLASILALADHLSQQRVARGQKPLTMGDVTTALVKAHEIQGCLALENSFNRVGLDHVVLVKVASTAVTAQMLGLSPVEIANAVSNAWVDGQSLRTYRHFPNTGSRKSWAAGDAAARGVRLSLMTAAGEMGYPTALSSKIWGFYDVLFRGNKFKFQRPYGSYVMETVLFKVSFPAEFHSQTAVEAAVKLHPAVKGRWDDIKTITLSTHEAACRIIDKTGPLKNPADRDHCLQYMVAVPLLHGDLRAEHYEEDFAADPRIDALREKMVVVENPQFTKDYHDPNKRSIANTVQVEFKDGSKTDAVHLDFPLGHRNRRQEAIPLIEQKFERAVAGVYAPKHARAILDVAFHHDRWMTTSVNDFMRLMAGPNVHH